MRWVNDYSKGCRAYKQLMIFLLQRSWIAFGLIRKSMGLGEAVSYTLKKVNFLSDINFYLSLTQDPKSCSQEQRSHWSKHLVAQKE